MENINNKICSVCGKEKHIHVKNPRMCRCCYDKHLKETNPDYRQRQLENCKQWAKNNRERIKKYNFNRRTIPEKRERDKTTHKRVSLRNIGMTFESCDKLIQIQNNCCAICGRNLNEVTKQLDHNHDTKKARGYLCSRCNNGLGFFLDSKEFLLKAINYLDNPPTNILWKELQDETRIS